MDYIKEYKSFISSHYLSDGVRITAGIVLPAVLLNHFNLLAVGVVVSLGAMSVSITDTPGPIQHRKNGMLACSIINTLMALLTGFAASQHWMLAMLIVIACFLFSMIAVYGTRANSIGVSALLIMVLNISGQQHGWDIAINAAYILAGAVWYTLLSLLLYSFRPYKLAQQALGDCIMATANYLRVRAAFYEKEVDYEKTYQQMMEQQIVLHNEQNLVRELLFKSRNVLKESTITGRTLLMLFTDIVDLFERTMASYHDYRALHDAFEEDDILNRYRSLVLELANELDEIGIAVKSGETSEESGELSLHIDETKKYFNTFRDNKRTAENVDAFISLRHILNSISDIAGRIHTLHLYTAYDKELSKKMVGKKLDYDKFITHQTIDLKLFIDNLSFTSNNFRHAVRISIATLMGFIVSLFFPLGHSYWILLTIIVILKPAYSLTKKRNYERVIGTIFGAAAGLLILYFIKDNQVLFFIMLALMIGTYSLIRSNYMISVIFMTPYVLVLLHLLSNDSFKTIIIDRVADTAIGSAIAFLANLILLPAWEQGQVSNYMLEAIRSNKNYFNTVALAFKGEPLINTDYKVNRKNAFVALANLSDAFTRMLSDPKSKQKNIKPLHQFVVLNHMLTAHIATLAAYATVLAQKYASPDFAAAITNASARLHDAEKIIENIPADTAAPETIPDHIQQRLQQLLQARRHELQQGILKSDTQLLLTEFKPIADQFNFIVNIASDIKKTSIQWTED
jgi:uncharacterized membrane protein (TIGR01666 family)